jgi:heavy metal sensor kinase
MHVARSLRLRLAVLYSGVLVLLAGLLMLGVYLALAHSLGGGAVPDRTAVVGGAQARVVTAQELERQVNQHALERLQDYSLAAIGILFVASLLVGWVVAGRALAPVDRVTRIARDIGATNLERRIRLGGPDDELRRLADTFDDMLERLDDAFRSQRSFAADATHELRTPLAVVQANADLLLSQPDDPATVRVRAGRIRAASERLARLGDDLLALARLDEQRPRRETVALERLVEDLAGELEEPAAEAGVVLAVRGEPVAAAVDRLAVRRAVANLVENALRHAPAGSTVRLASGEQGRWAWIAVEDDGPGIDPAHRARVFDRFYRVDRARSRADGGTGLGLAIVREVARAHGGDVRLHSEPGCGACFVLWLPARPGPDGAPEPPPRALAAPLAVR